MRFLFLLDVIKANSDQMNLLIDGVLSFSLYNVDYQPDHLQKVMLAVGLILYQL